MTDELRRLQTCRLDEAPHRCRHSLLDKSRQRPREHDAKTYGIDHPAHDIERARPGVLGDRSNTRTPLPGLGPKTTAAAPSPNKAEEITSAFVMRSGREINVHNSMTTTSTTSPGSARAKRAPSARPEAPPAQPRPKTGTRITDGRKPSSVATRASSPGVAMPVEDTVTTTSTSRAAIPARSSAAFAV